MQTDTRAIREILARTFQTDIRDPKITACADEIYTEITGRETKRHDPVTDEIAFARSKSPAVQLSLEIESALQIQFGWSCTGTKGGIEFVNEAVKQTLAGKHYQKLLDYVKAEGIKYWTFSKMKERYGEAFLNQESNKPTVPAGKSSNFERTKQILANYMGAD